MVFILMNTTKSTSRRQGREGAALRIRVIICEIWVVICTLFEILATEEFRKEEGVIFEEKLGDSYISPIEPNTFWGLVISF